MIMDRLRRMLCLLFALSVSLLFLPFTSDINAAHEEHVTESAHEGAEAELPGDVPFDIALEEIQKYIAPMNELEIFPCIDCHDVDWETDSRRRELFEPHDEIPGKFLNHDSDNRWCLDCHSPDNRNELRLLNGTLINFDEYYRVCEQCHKRIYREWKAGVHGKRTGHWNGEKQWMHCTQCHNPHNPPFQAIKPEPAPEKPLKVWSATAAKDARTADTHD